MPTHSVAYWWKCSKGGVNPTTNLARENHAQAPSCATERTLPLDFCACEHSASNNTYSTGGREHRRDTSSPFQPPDEESHSRDSQFHSLAHMSFFRHSGVLDKHFSLTEIRAHATTCRDRWLSLFHLSLLPASLGFPNGLNHPTFITTSNKVFFPSFSSYSSKMSQIKSRNLTTQHRSRDSNVAGRAQ